MKYVWLVLLYLEAIFGGISLAAGLFSLWWLLTCHLFVSETVLYSIMAAGGLGPALWVAVTQAAFWRRHGRIALLLGLLISVLCGIVIWQTN